MRKRFVITPVLLVALCGALPFFTDGEDITTKPTTTEITVAATPIPLTFEEQLANAKNSGLRLVKLVPYSGAISHPRSSPNQTREANNKRRFEHFFGVDEIYLTVDCTTNHRGHESSRTIGAVVPDTFYNRINSEFEDGTRSYFGRDICTGERSTTLRSVDVSFSVINQ